MRGLARKLAAVVVGTFGTWAVTALTNLGVSPGDAVAVVGNVEFIIMVGLLALFTFSTEHLLKYVKRWFPGDWADEVWRSQAGDKVGHVPRATAERKIRDGDV